MPNIPDHIAARIQAAALRDFADELEHTGKGQNSSSIAAMARTRASSLLVDFPESSQEESVERDLASLLNYYSQDTQSGTPDFILAEFMLHCLYHFQESTVKRAEWRGESVELPALQKLHAARPDIFGKDANLTNTVQSKSAPEPRTIKKGFFGGNRKF